MIFGYSTLFLVYLGSHNDINVLEMSFIFSDLAQERAPPINYIVNGYNYNMRYYLALAYIHSVWHLLKQFHLHKEIRENTLLQSKSQQRKMWSGRLEYFRHDL
jgi:hypothetical protein